MQLLSKEIVGDGAGPHLLITGGVHGDEFEPMAAIRRLAREVEPSMLRGRLTLVPVVNEPAFQRGCRTAEDGLDLARTCPGRKDGTWTERIAFALSELIRSADYYIDLHTGGTRLRVLPMVGYMLHPDCAILDAQRRMAQAFNLPMVWGTDHRLNGRSLSVARDARVPAIYAEYHGGGACDPSGVEAYAHGCLNVMASLGMLDRPTPPSIVRHVVEDPRPSSGHLQVCHPSPVSGFFEPAVKLGDQVRVGDVLGAVSDPLSNDVQTIHSNQAGIVLVLHTFASIKRGESAAVILETSVPSERLTAAAVLPEKASQERIE